MNAPRVQHLADVSILFKGATYSNTPMKANAFKMSLCGLKSCESLVAIDILWSSSFNFDHYFFPIII